MTKVEVITGPERRRRWSAEQKRAIVAESLGVGNGFAQVLIAPAGDDAGCPAASAIGIAFAGKARMRIAASIPAGLAAAVVKALSAVQQIGVALATTRDGGDDSAAEYYEAQLPEAQSLLVRLVSRSQ